MWRAINKEKAAGGEQPDRFVKGSVMKVFRPIWRVPYLLGFVAASLCANEMEYEGNYADNYDNEISQDQQEGEICLFVLSSLLFHACLNRWLVVKKSHYLPVLKWF